MALAFNGEGNCFYVPDEDLKHELTPQAIQELDKILRPSGDTPEGDVQAYRGDCCWLPERARSRDGCDTVRDWFLQARDEPAKVGGEIKVYFRPYR